MIPVTLQKYYIRPKETGDRLEGSEIWGAGRIVAHTEVIPERHSLAAESEFSSEIATSNARHSIALRPSPVKSPYRHVGFAQFPHSGNAVSQDLAVVGDGIVPLS
jgi:hypothetical protein